MTIAAVPNYLQEKDPEFYLAAPPGHRFLLYFAAWGENAETSKIDWRMKDRVPKIDKRTKQQKIGKSGPEWEDTPNDQFACTIAACKTPQLDEDKPRTRKPKTDPGLKPWRQMMEALLTRQEVAAAQLGTDSLLRLDATATAPFTTGLGNEHPLENGFAFLNPYGLPYVPGSGVKGVLRQAARELSGGEWGETKGWSEEKKHIIEAREERIPLSVIDVLFGLEPGDGDNLHARGVLSFWDVIPRIEGDSLMVEIMTPHQSHYYQQKRERRSGDSVSPHDSGQPTPISFLTVPPGSGFTFLVTCDTARLERLAPELGQVDPESGKPCWETLMQAAFEHAFQWLGFGAKTAVGYGAMETGAMRRERVRSSASDRLDGKDTTPRFEEAEAVWPAARLIYNPGAGEIKARFEGKTTSGATGDAAKAILAALGDRAAKLKKKKELANVSVRIREKGNLVELLGLGDSP